MPEASDDEYTEEDGKLKHPPPDRFNVVYIILVIVGLGSLIPWNFFATARMYFDYKLRNISISNNTSNITILTTNQLLYGNVVAVCSMVPNAIMNTANLYLKSYMSAFKRFVIGAILMCSMFILTVILVEVPTDQIQDAFFIVTMVSVIVINIGGSLIQGSMFGVASMFPSKYMKAVMEGQAAAGIVASVANIVTIALASTVLNSAFAYFMIAIVITVIIVALFMLLPRLAFSRYYVHRTFVRTMNASPRITHSDAIINHTMDENTEETEPMLPPTPHHPHSIPIMTVLTKLLLPGMSVFLVFAVSLCLFPACIAMVHPMVDVSSDLWTHTYFTPVICFLLFNVTDYLGRFLAGTVKWPRQDRRWLLFTFCSVRVVFIPLVLLCNMQPRRNLPVLLTNDAWPGLITTLLGITNGYLATLCMMYGPGMLGRGHEETGGTAMSMFLTWGLAAGVTVSFGLPPLV